MGVRAAAGGLFELDSDGDGGLRLVGGFSPSTGRHHFPLSEVCPYTGADDVERVLLSDRGTLWGWTTVTVAPPGYRGDVPYGFGIVELTQERLLVVSRLTHADPADLCFGAPMRLVADTVFTDEDGDDVVTWAFAPAS